MSNSKNKYFGTDGFRGEAGVGLTALHAYKIGRFLGWYYSSALSGCMETCYRPRAVIGKDTRISGDMLECALAAGLCASGADAYLLHVVTTPCVAYITREDGFDFGVMITASHNPFGDNGIKIIGRSGEKLCSGDEALAEAYIDGDMQKLCVRGELPFAKGRDIGRVFDYAEGKRRYTEYLSSLGGLSLAGLRIGLDTANGASHEIAAEVFRALGASVYLIGAEPTGVNVNEACGSTHTEKLCALVRENKLDAGFAFDGDGDRCIAVDENGSVADGDKILYVLAKRLKRKCALSGGAVVATVMSNSGLSAALEREGISCVQTAVGDRFVYERMKKEGYTLGGEQSGHVIMRAYATTGDGILTALMLAEEMRESGKGLCELAAPVVLRPQYLRNVRVKDKGAAAADSAVTAAVKRAESFLGSEGRVLLRQSGTEPVLRINIECADEEKCMICAEAIERAITEGGYALG